jgi:hypothetical protein
VSILDLFRISYSSSDFKLCYCCPSIIRDISPVNELDMSSNFHFVQLQCCLARVLACRFDAWSFSKGPNEYMECVSTPTCVVTGHGNALKYTESFMERCRGINAGISLARLVAVLEIYPSSPWFEFVAFLISSTMWRLCTDAAPFDFEDPCIRSSWGALLPASFVFLLCIASIPIPLPRLLAVLKSPFQSYMTLYEAEALDFSSSADKVTIADTSTEIQAIPLWRTVVFAFVGLVEALSWLSYGSYNLINNTDQLSHSPSPVLVRLLLDPISVGPAISPFLIALSWVYTVVRSVVKPSATPPYDLCVVYLAQLLAAVLMLGGVLFDYSVVGITPQTLVLLALSANLGAVLGLLVVLGNMPLGVPSNHVKKEDIVSFRSVRYEL